MTRLKLLILNWQLRIRRKVRMAGLLEWWTAVVDECYGWVREHKQCAGEWSVLQRQAYHGLEYHYQHHPSQSRLQCTFGGVRGTTHISQHSLHSLLGDVVTLVSLGEDSNAAGASHDATWALSC